MECKICELKHRQFFCKTCLKTHLRDFQHQTQHFAVDRDEQVLKATKALETIQTARLSRAHVADCQSRLEEVMAGLARLRKENDKKRDRLRSLRESLATRRRSLSAAKLQPARHSPAPGLSHLTQRETQELNALSMTIARARSGLVQELVEVFNVVEVGGRPPIGGKAGTKGEWTIGDLILPVPGDIRRYPPDHINAVITHTIHFLSLLTFYLGVKLPFEFVWTGGKLGVGQPWIGAIMGPESGGWARWSTKHPLHLSSSSPNPPQPDETPPTPTAPLSESYIDTIPPPNTPASFTAALAMLLYDVSYLAHTQNVDVPLSQAGDVLSNLWSVCCSAELGRRSHETTPRLLPPTGLAFHLDFAQLLQATAAHPRSTRVVRRKAGGMARQQRTVDAVKEEEEGWDMVEGDSL